MEDLLREIKESSVELRNLEDEVSMKEKKIKLLGNQLLKHLRALPGWESLILHLPGGYLKNPDLIFVRGYIYECSVYCDKNCIYWQKGYSDGTDYIVLRIYFDKSLEDQIKEAMEEKSREKEKKDFNEFSKDLETYYSIKKKYNL